MRPFIAVLAAVAAVIAPQPALAADFPVTVSHVYGETIVPAEPQRVVSIGLNDHDFLYALGIAPVGVKEWWGEQPYATWPWAEEQRQALGAEPAVLTSIEINIEWVAAQQPDLIVAVYSDIDATTYGLLSEIAPVIPRPEGYPMYGAPWQEQLRQIERGTLGSTGKSDEIIASLESATAEARAAYPELAGKTGSMADYRDGQFTLWATAHAPTRFVTSFGLTFPDELDALADNTGWIYLSPEKIELMDLDVVVWPTGKRDEIEKLSVYRNTGLFKEARSVWFEDSGGVLSAALWFQTPLSLEYAIERTGPMLAAAADGDPSTTVNTDDE